jgi:hypothetical protein
VNECKTLPRTPKGRETKMIKGATITRQMENVNQAAIRGRSFPQIGADTRSLLAST